MSENINPSLSSLIVPIGKLKTDPRNLRAHPEKSLDAITKSLQQFGQQKPVVALKDGTVIAGNGMLEAARGLGWQRLAVVTFQDKTKAQAYAIADNRTAELSVWDDRLLAGVLKAMQKDGQDLAQLAFTDKDLSEIILAAENKKPGETTEGITPPPPKIPLTKPGDIWTMGPHRMMCADAKDSGALAKLFETLKFSACITSPPYSDLRTYNLGEFNWLELMTGAWDALSPFAAAQAHVLVNLGLSWKERRLNRYWDPWIDHVEKTGWPLFGWYVWDKMSAVPGDFHGRLALCHEWIFHFNREPSQARKVIKTKSYPTGDKFKKRFRIKDGSLKAPTGPTKMGQEFKVPDSVVRVLREANNQTNHPAVFSVDFAAFLMKAFSEPGDLIYEPFSGSGTTIMAAEQLGRRCFAIDIDPAYCDVAVERWEKHTGKKARKN